MELSFRVVGDDNGVGENGVSLDDVVPFQINGALVERSNGDIRTSL